MRRRRPLVAGLVALLALLGPAAGGGAAAVEPAATRILLMGDSLTQGSAGDFTWRYRLWQHLAGTGGPVDLVGPRDDLFDNVSAVQGSHDYVDPDFDTDHAARWGQSLAFPDWSTADLVTAYRPDVVVVLLGLNDLTWLGEAPAEVDARLRQLVADARSADPAVSVVLTHIPNGDVDGVVELNALIDLSAAELTTVGSPVVVADADAGYLPGDDTWDRVHPNARGEVTVASAVADALATLGIGAPYPRPLPEVPLGPRLPATVTSTAGDRVVGLSWTGSPGSTAQVVWLRDTTADTPWSPLPDPVTGTSTVVGGLANGHAYAFRLQPVKGRWAAEDDVRSNLTLATPLPPPPGPVAWLTATATGTTAVLEWAPAAGATGYQVEYVQPDAGLPEVTVPELVTTTTTAVPDLLPGRTYRFTVRGADAGVLGGPSPAATVWFRPVTPPAPTNVRAAQVPTRAVRLTWDPLPVATQFRVLTRDVTRGTAWRRVWFAAPVTGTQATVTGLRVGDVHAFTVRAVCLTLVGPASTVARLRLRSAP